MQCDDANEQVFRVPSIYKHLGRKLMSSEFGLLPTCIVSRRRDTLASKPLQTAAVNDCQNEDAAGRFFIENDMGAMLVTAYSRRYRFGLAAHAGIVGQ